MPATLTLTLDNGQIQIGPISSNDDLHQALQIVELAADPTAFYEPADFTGSNGDGWRGTYGQISAARLEWTR